MVALGILVVPYLKDKFLSTAKNVTAPFETKQKFLALSITGELKKDVTTQQVFFVIKQIKNCVENIPVC